MVLFPLDDRRVEHCRVLRNCIDASANRSVLRRCGIIEHGLPQRNQKCRGQVTVTQKDGVYTQLNKPVAHPTSQGEANAAIDLAAGTDRDITRDDEMANRPNALHQSGPEDCVSMLVGACAGDGCVAGVVPVSDMGWLSALRHLKSRLFANLVSMTVLQAANFLVPLILLPYLLHCLGSSHFGLLMFAQAFAMTLSLIIGYGYEFSATQQIAIHRDDPQAISRIFCTTLTIRLTFLLSILFIATVFVLSLPRFRVDWPLYLVTFLAPIGMAISPNWLYQGMEEVRQLACLNLIARAVAFACTLVFVHSETDYVLAALFESGRVAAAGVAALVLTRRIVPIVIAMPTYRMLRESLRDGWHFYVAIVCGTVYTSSPVLFLGLLADHSAVAFYSLAEKPVRAAIALSTLPMSIVVFPRISALVHESLHEAAVFLRRLVCLAGGGAFLLSCAIFLGRGQILSLVFGTVAAPSIPVLGYLAWLPVLSMMTNILSIQTMVPFGMSRLVSRVLLAAAFLHLALLLPFAYYMGAEGASISVVLTDLFMSGCMAILLARKGLLSVLAGKSAARASWNEGIGFQESIQAWR